MSESFDDIVREYIAFVNAQVGMYIDALAGFAGHHARVEQQQARVLRPSSERPSEKGHSVVVWASYEDPARPDIIHNRVIRAVDYVAANAPGGSNEQQHARAIIVFLFTFWEDEIRPRLAQAKGVATNDIGSDIMGDLRILRHAILHSRSIVRAEEHRRLRKVAELVPVGQPLSVSHEVMHQIFALIKQDCGRLMFDWLGVKDSPIAATEIRDIAIQKPSRSKT